MIYVPHIPHFDRDNHDNETPEEKKQREEFDWYSALILCVLILLLTLHLFCSYNSKVDSNSKQDEWIGWNTFYPPMSSDNDVPDEWWVS